MRFTRLTREVGASNTALEGARKKVQIAIVGSGPSGCYVADFLTRNNTHIHVDMFEKLPVPFGLSRYGVAPDHPEVKNVEQKFREMFESNRVSWLGNIEVGKELPFDTLRSYYTAVVIATGAYGDRSLSIPGEDLGNVLNARQFVNYYNTYPFPHGSPQFCPFDMDDRKLTDVVVIGNGNVSLDVARVLGTSYKHWCPTDMNAVAIRQLMNNRIRRITICGRRAVEHGAFAIAELRELINHDPKRLTVSADPFQLDEVLARIPSEMVRPKKRLLELLSKLTVRPDVVQPDKPTRDRGPCSVHFSYNLKPVEFLPHAEKKNMVGAVRFEKQNAEGQPTEDVVLPCQVAFKSLGSTSEPLRGLDGAFDSQSGRLLHTEGRVKDHMGLYCTGWAKNGGKGVILHAMMDGQSTANAILHDIANGTLVQSDRHEGKFGLLDHFVAKNLYPISIAALKRIWYVEEERGKDLGKKGEKVNNVEQMLQISMGGAVGKRANNKVRGIANARPDAMLYLGQLLDDDTDLSSLAADIAKAHKFKQDRPS